MWKSVIETGRQWIDHSIRIKKNGENWPRKGEKVMIVWFLFIRRHYCLEQCFFSANLHNAFLSLQHSLGQLNLFFMLLMLLVCKFGKEYKGETGHPLKIRLEDHKKFVSKGEEESGMVIHTWRGKGSCHSLSQSSNSKAGSTQMWL